MVHVTKVFFCSRKEGRAKRSKRLNKGKVVFYFSVFMTLQRLRSSVENQGLEPEDQPLQVFSKSN